MSNNLRKRFIAIASLALFAVSSAIAQEHKWAGRNLDDLEWTVHEKLAVLPFYGVFDTIRFELNGNDVVLTGQVVKESVKHNAERSVKQIPGVHKVSNRIEVLPSSRRDDVLRQNVYRAIYEKAPLTKYSAREVPPVHILVKDGWVSLEGVVDSSADRSLVHLRALEVTAHVSDNLRVASSGS